MDGTCCPTQVGKDSVGGILYATKIPHKDYGVEEDKELGYETEEQALDNACKNLSRVYKCNVIYEVEA